MYPRAFVVAATALVGALFLPALPAAATTVSPVAPSAAAPDFAASGALAASPPSAASDVQWAVAPADAAGPDGRVSLRHAIDPGASVADAIAITNLGNAPARYAVVPGDGVLGDDGAFDIAAGDPQDSGTWISVEGLDAGTVTVAPGETRVLPVRIDVPAGVTPGDHPAGIVVGMSRSADGVTVTNRVGVRVHLRVAGDIAPALAVGDVSATFTPSWIPFAPGILRVETRVENSGNVRLGALALVGGPGIDASTPAVDAVEMLPGDRAVLVSETPAWPLVVLFGSADIRPVVLGDDALTPPAPVSASFVAPAPTWTGLAVVLLAATFVVAWVIARRRSRRAAEGATPAASVDAGDEAGSGGRDLTRVADRGGPRTR